MKKEGSFEQDSIQDSASELIRKQLSPLSQTSGWTPKIGASEVSLLPCPCRDAPGSGSNKDELLLTKNKMHAARNLQKVLRGPRSE